MARRLTTGPGYGQCPQRRWRAEDEMRLDRWLLPGLAQATKDVLESASYLPFCEFLDKQTAQVLPSAYVVKRGQRLAELAVERLWPMLA